MPETTPVWGLQAPLGTEPISQGDDLWRANNVILEGALPVFTFGNEYLTVLSGTPRASQVVTFGVTYRVPPMIVVTVIPASEGDVSHFYYAHYYRDSLTTTGAEIVVQHKDAGPGTDQGVRVRWMAVGVR